jgi:hypothetical protein
MSIQISNNLLRPRDFAATRLLVPRVSASLEACGLPESEEREASLVEELVLVLPHHKRRRVEARSALAQSESERAPGRLSAAMTSSADSQTFLQQECSRLAAAVSLANNQRDDELARREALEAVLDNGQSPSSTSSAVVLKTLNAIKTTLAAKVSDMYTCPRVLFMKAVMAWLEFGRFVDPHLLSPKYLLSLKVQTPSKDDLKLRHDPSSGSAIVM